MPDNYISHTSERDDSTIEIHTITINIASLPNIEFAKKWSLQRQHVNKYVNVLLGNLDFFGIYLCAVSMFYVLLYYEFRAGIPLKMCRKLF